MYFIDTKRTNSFLDFNLRQMEQKRYIFLDIDGVINYPEWYERIIKECGRKDCSKMKMTEFHVDPLCVQRLNKLEGAEVVISSSCIYNKYVPCSNRMDSFLP